MKTENKALAALAAVCGASLLLGLAYAAALPLFIAAPPEKRGAEHIAPSTDPLPFDLKTLKLAMPFSRAHPLYQLASLDLAELLGLAPSTPFLLEVYPAGTLGSREETLKGVSLGTIELCFADDGIFDLVPGLSDSWKTTARGEEAGGALDADSPFARRLRDREIVPLAWFESGRRQLWSVRSEISKGSRRAPLSPLNPKTARLVSKFALEGTGQNRPESPAAARSRELGYVELTFSERRFQGWESVAEKVVEENLYEVPVFILMGAGPYYSLDRAHREAVRAAAEKLARTAASLMKRTETGIRTDLQAQYLR